MRILAIETSSARLSLAVGTEDRILKDYQGPLAWRHAESVFDGMEKLLAHVRWPVGSLTGIVVSTGPGSFTGIRIGLATARALGQTLRVPVVGVSSLETLARAHVRPGSYVCPVIDALRGDVFTALYQATASGSLKTLRAESRLALPDLIKKLKPLRRQPLTFAGDAVTLHRDALKKETTGSWSLASEKKGHPDARTLLELGRTRLSSRQASYERVVPLYLRSAAAEERRASPAARRAAAVERRAS